MLIWVYKTSEGIEEGKAEDYEGLDECFEELTTENLWGKWEPQIIVSLPRFKDYVEGMDECTYTVEIYDAWREGGAT